MVRFRIKTNLRKLGFVVVVGVFIPLVPFIVFVGSILLSKSVPKGLYLVYPGISAEVIGGQVVEIVAITKDVDDFHLFPEGSPKRIQELDALDIQSIGFRSDLGAYIKGGRPNNSFAFMGQDGKLEELVLAHTPASRVKFSKLPDGPLLELPISRRDFEKVFGKPKSTRYSFPSSGFDPR